MNVSVVSMSFVTRSPFSFSSRLAFSLVFLLQGYTCKSSCCLSHPSPDGTSDTLWFSQPHCCMLRLFLHFYCPCFHLCTLPSYVCVRSVAAYSSMKAACNLCLTSCFWRWTKLQVGRGDPWKSTSSWRTPLCSRMVSHGVLPSRSPSRPKFILLKSRAVILLFVLFHPLRNLTSPFHEAAKAAPSLHIFDQSFLVDEYQVQQSWT